jgi:calcineurin-like phosphoesterase family protein
MKKSEETTRKNTWFTSDTHWGHANIIKFCNRPFADITEHDEMLIKNWNDCVQPGDDVYHLGDFALRRDPQAVFRRLNGNKHLVIGNHDREKRMRQLDWAWVKDVYYLKLGKRPSERIWLSHFPHLSWNKSHKGSMHLHGHCHGELPDDGRSRRADVGVDVWDFKPVHLDTILAFMKDRGPTHHHDRTRT